MTPLTVADFVEANAEHFELNDKTLTVNPDSEPMLHRKLVSLFISEPHRIVAGPTQGALVVPTWHYSVKDQTFEERPFDIVLESHSEKGGLCTISLVEFLNAFAHNELPGDDPLNNQLLGL